MVGVCDYKKGYACCVHAGCCVYATCMVSRLGYTVISHIIFMNFHRTKRKLHETRAHISSVHQFKLLFSLVWAEKAAQIKRASLQQWFANKGHFCCIGTVGLCPLSHHLCGSHVYGCEEREGKAIKRKRRREGEENYCLDT